MAALPIRKNYKLTQDQLAKMLQVARSTVARWEAGQFRPSKPMQKLLDRIERRLGKRVSK